MASGKQQHPKNKPQKRVQPNSPSANPQSDDSIKNDKASTYHPQHHSPQNSDVNPLIVKINKGKGIPRAEIISIVGIIISASLFFMTLRTFRQTKRSVDIADSTFKANKEKDAAIAIQFEKTHQPFLQATNFYLEPIPLDKEPTISFFITNITEIPIKILSYNTVVYIDSGAPTLDRMKSLLTHEIEDQNYVTKDAPVVYKFNLSLDSFRRTLPEVIMGINHVYIVRRFRYINLVTDKRREYLFYVRLDRLKPGDVYTSIFPNGTYRDIIYNENYPADTQ